MKKVFLLMLIMIIASPSFALDTETHKSINEHIAKKAYNSFSLDTYLKNLCVEKGVEEEIKLDNQLYTVYELIGIGGKYEDIPAWYMPYLRSKNHFHNPINNAGFSGIAESGLIAGMSAVNWA